MLKSVILGSVLAMMTMTSAHALVFTEIGDAGRRLETANVFPTGNLPITRINGRKPATDGVDMFKIYIEDTSSFSARVRNNGTNILDPQLFLFDADGFGVRSNDDRRNTLLPRIRGFSGSEGYYYLAITGFDNDPVSSLGEIFPNNFRGQLQATGPGGSLPLSGWTNTGLPENRGRYSIAIQGATTSVSEPATVGLMGMALAVFAGLSRRRRAA